ncbi:MAG: sugar-binding domain-containing protein [Christensenellales bacterium]
MGDNACINAGYGDTLSRTLNHLATMVQTPVTCISLTGGVSYYLPNGRSNVFNARLYLMPAPLLASSHEMAAAMRAEASVSEIIRMAKLSSFTLVGIGSMHETATIVRSGIITQERAFPPAHGRGGRRRALSLRQRKRRTHSQRYRRTAHLHPA